MVNELVHKCSECDKPVVVHQVNGATAVKRDCGHDTAGVVVELSATVYGISSLNKEQVNGV